MRAFLGVGWAVVITAGCSGSHAPERSDGSIAVIDGAVADASFADAGLADAAVVADAAPGAPAAVTFAASGSRLKGQSYLTDDRLRVPASTNVFYDSLLGQTCTVSTSGTSAYCLPVFDEVSFSDAACTQPFIIANAPTTTVNGDLDANGVLHRYSEGTPHQRSATWEKSGDQCIADELSSLGFPGVDDAPVQLAQVTTTFAGSGAQQLGYFTSSDGLSWPRQIAYDTTLAATCSLEITSPTAGVCVPAVTDAEEFHDASCTQRVAEVPHGTTPPAYAVDVDACTPAGATALYGIGALTTRVAYDLGSNGACTVGMTFAQEDYYLVGPQVATMAALTRAPQVVAGHRLAGILLGNAALMWFVGLLSDPVTATQCGFAPTPDGDIRCVPPAAVATTMYTDPGCTAALPVMIVDDDTGCAGVLGTVPTYALVKTDPVASTYHAVGAQLTGTYYVANASSCAAYSPGGAGEPFRLFAVDPTGLPLTTWQPATLAYDP